MSSSTVRLSRTLARGCKIVLRIADMSMMPTQLLVQVPQDRESERATEPHRETETERHTHTHIEKRYDECKPTPLKHAHTQEQTRKRMHTCKLFSLPLHANLVCTHTHTLHGPAVIGEHWCAENVVCRKSLECRGNCITLLHGDNLLWGREVGERVALQKCNGISSHPSDVAPGLLLLLGVVSQTKKQKQSQKQQHKCGRKQSV